MRRSWPANRYLACFFFITLSLTLFAPILFPGLHLLYFAPFVCCCYYYRSYAASLWISLLCGLIIDLLSAPLRFGLHALNFTLTTAFLYSKKQHFFQDQLSTLPILTFFFSLISTLIQLILLYIFETSLTLSWKWVFTDLLWMPCTDGIYAFICFSLPIIIWGKTPRRGKDYFM